MAHRFLRDPEADGWEPSDFPILCQSCLGECPCIRMLKSADYDKGCNICTRPFTVCRWRPGRDARYKQTLICRTCTKLKNVCQVCLLDLQYGLPVQVTDTAMAIHSHDSIPKSDVKAPPSDTILKLQRTTPYYKRNRAPLCTFYARGTCNRGAECPYRHGMPVTGELSRQNIKDRYYGLKDPVAERLLKKACQMPSLTPPDDESITTLYIGGLNARVTEQDLVDMFYSHGEIESVRIVLKLSCGFVTYRSREGAERAAEELSNKLVIKGSRMKLLWGKSQARRAELEEQQQQQQPSYLSIPPPPSRTCYPSMDPQRMGAVASS